LFSFLLKWGHFCHVLSLALWCLSPFSNSRRHSVAYGARPRWFLADLTSCLAILCASYDGSFSVAAPPRMHAVWVELISFLSFFRCSVVVGFELYRCVYKFAQQNLFRAWSLCWILVVFLPWDCFYKPCQHNSSDWKWLSHNLFVLFWQW
jgi:hypothetical protein